MSKSKKIKIENEIKNEPVAAEVEKEDITNTSIAAESEKEDMKDSTIAAAKVGVVNVDRLNVRKNPTIESDVVKIINKNDEVIIIEEEGEFYKVKDGFVMQKFIDEK